MADLRSTEHFWVGNRRIWEVLRAELHGLRPAFADLLPDTETLDQAIDDLTELASAGLLDAVAWTFSAPPGDGAGLPHLLYGAQYRIILPPAPAPLAPAPPARRLFSGGEFHLHFHPARRLADLPQRDRRNRLQSTALPWDDAGTERAPVRPFQVTRVWPLPLGSYLVKETSSVGGI